MTNRPKPRAWKMWATFDRSGRLIVYERKTDFSAFWLSAHKVFPVLVTELRRPR